LAESLQFWRIACDCRLKPETAVSEWRLARKVIADLTGTLMLTFLSWTLFTLAGSAPAAAQVPAGTAAAVQCLPRDDAAQRPDFFSFRAQLQIAVARRDRAAVLAVTHPQIRTSFGPDDGLASFTRDLADPKGPLWEELASVLSLGGRFDKEMFVAPYTFGCGDAFEDVVVIGGNVSVRAKPAGTSTILKEVHFEVLRGTMGDRNWAEVTLADGGKGYIAAQYVRSPIGYRAFFRTINGSWRLVTFIAGD
jgi:hypothetical protein